MKRFSIAISLFITLVLMAVSCIKETPESAIPVSGVSLSPKSIEISEGELKGLTVTIFPSNATNKNVSFSSSDESIATVTSDGVVKGIAPGNAMVTATTEDGNYKAHCNVKIVSNVIHVITVSLDKTELTLEEKEDTTLTVTITPDNATDKSVTWSSDAESVVSVSQDGKLKALKAGNATITVTSKDGGKSASCKVEVVKSIGIITDGSSNISCRNAKLSGRITDIDATVKEFGILYSTSSGVPAESSVNIKGSKLDFNSGFSIVTDVLDPETQYYYCAYAIGNSGETIRGAVKSFATLGVDSMIRTENTEVTSNTTAILNGTLDLTDCIYSEVEYGFELTPEDGATDNKLTTNLSDKKFSGKVESLTLGGKYSVVAFVRLDGHKYKGKESRFIGGAVDLGLSVYWAVCNLGAPKPEVCGGYYQWAGTMDVSSTSIDILVNCPYFELDGRWTKYNERSSSGIVDNKTVLEPMDDAASVNMGGDWRMPTVAEWTELKDNCTWTWTTQNGVLGYKVTSNKTEYTSNFIFLPALGMRYFDEIIEVGKRGNYWSSSLSKEYTKCGSQMEFESDYALIFNGLRYYGMSVRPVLVRE